MSSLLRRSLALAVATATLAGGAGAQAQARAVASTRVDAMRYGFVMVTGEDETPARGTITSSGDRARLEMERGARVRMGGKRAGAEGRQDSNDWFLLTEGGRRIAIVDDDERQYHEMDAATFTDIVGKAMRVVDKFMTMEVEEPTVTVERMGDGGVVAGQRTQRWVVTQEFTTNVGMFGKTERELHRVVTDYWIAPGLALPENPLFELVTRGEAALAQADAGYVDRVRRARERLPRGAAMRIMVTSASSELSDGKVKPPKVQRLEVTDLAKVAVDPALLRVPAGYEKSKMDGLNIDI